LRGIIAHCRLRQGVTAAAADTEEVWTIKQQWESRQAGVLQVEPQVRKRLETFVRALQQPIKERNAPAMMTSTSLVTTVEDATHA